MYELPCAFIGLLEMLVKLISKSFNMYILISENCDPTEVTQLTYYTHAKKSILSLHASTIYSHNQLRI